LNSLLPSLKDTENIVRAEKDFFFHVVGTFSVNSSVSLFLLIIQQRGLSYMVFNCGRDAPVTVGNANTGPAGGLTSP
jgi:hypothetical protein